MSTEPLRLVLSAYDAFARRDVEQLVDLCSPSVELAVPTATITHGGEPYRGREGLRRYFLDVSRVWSELRLVPQRCAESGGAVVVTGRVYGRDIQGGVIDSPAGWVWTLDSDRIRRIRAFASHEEALAEAGVSESRLEPLVASTLP